MLLIEDPSMLCVFLDLLNDSVIIFGISFASSKCKVLLQGWIGSKPILVAREQLGEVDRFRYLCM